MELRETGATFLQNKNLVMFIVTFTFILGVVAFYNGIEILFAILITLCSLLLLRFRFINLPLAILTIIMFYLGFLNSELRIKDFDEISLLAPAEVTLEGQIVTIPENTGSVIKFYFDVNGVNDSKIDGKTLVWINDKKRYASKLEIGNHIKIKGNLRLPNKVGNPSQFNYARFLQNKGVYSILYANGKNFTVEDQPLTLKWKFLQSLNKLRSKILNIHRQYLKSPNLEILGGIVFGDDAVAPPEHIKNSFVNSGLLHILAASGMNVAFIFGFWFFFMSKFRVSYRITLISGILLIILYTLMTGLGASVVRATLMLTFVLIGKLFDRDAHSVSLLSFVALLMLIYNPAYLNDIGFQMSFLATLGILTTGQSLQIKLKEIKFPEFIKGDLIIPVVAQCWVAPTQMFYFNTFAPYSILANIAIIPFLCIVSFGGFVSSILAIFYPFTKYLCQLMDSIINCFLTVIVKISHFFSTLDFSLITTMKPSVLQMFLYYSIVITITLLIKIGRDKKILTTLAVMALIFLCTFIRIPNNNFEVISFDVGNADAFLIKTPNNEYYVIDTGKFAFRSTNCQASMTIGKYMKDKGIKKIKTLIITHFDNDHAGGGAYFVENFDVEKVYLNSIKAKSATATAVFNALEITHTPYKIADTYEILESDKDFSVKLFRSDIPDSDNENSLQTLMNYKDFDILFTGDAGVKAFEIIKDKLPTNVEVLKVGHHGAKEAINQELLKTINPIIAIISTGQNRFGHPSRATLENLSRQNVKIFRTDYDNAIKITSDGNNIKTYTYNSLERKFVLNSLYDCTLPR